MRRKIETGGPIDVSARLRMPYGRLLVPEEDGGYRAEILEFPGCIAEGDDGPEALSELEAAAEGWIEAAMEMGTPIPPPLEESNFSGRLNLRLPKSLHRKAALAAELDGVSLNQLIVAALAEFVGRKSAQQVQSADPIVWRDFQRPNWTDQKVVGHGHRLVSGLRGIEATTSVLQDTFEHARDR